MAGLPLAAGLFDLIATTAHGIGRFLFWIIIKIRGPLTRSHDGMGLDQFPFQIETHQLAVFPDIDLLADIGGGYGVKGIAKADMVIGVDLAESPLRRIESLSGQAT